MKNLKMTTLRLIALLTSVGIVSCSSLTQNISLPEHRTDIYETESLDTSLEPEAIGMIYFEANSAILNDGEILRSGLPLLISSKNISNISNISIVGHDDVSGSASNSMVLSQRRANALRNYFISHGVDQSKISTEGKGEMELFLNTGDGVIEALNRRVEYAIQMKTKFGDCEDQAIREKNTFNAC